MKALQMWLVVVATCFFFASNAGAFSLVADETGFPGGRVDFQAGKMMVVDQAGECAAEQKVALVAGAEKRVDATVFTSAGGAETLVRLHIVQVHPQKGLTIQYFIVDLSDRTIYSGGLMK